MLILHQILPHVHPEHNHAHTDLEIVEHHHHDKNHDHQHGGNDTNTKKGIGFLFEGHVHPNQFIDYFEIIINARKNFKVNVFSCHGLPVALLLLKVEQGTNTLPIVHHPPGFITNLYLSTTSYRGPPVLV